MISEGDRLPDATFGTMTEAGPGQRTAAEVFDGRTVALMAVPGAFTPTCTNAHLPGFVEQAEALKGKGVDEVACVAVNDLFVLDAWAEKVGAKDKVAMLADGSGEFAKAIGMELDLGERGLGTRSKRYAMIVEDRTVKHLLVEDNPGQAQDSSADALMAKMG